MRYYFDEPNDIMYALEDDAGDEFIPANTVKVTTKKYKEWSDAKNQPLPPTPEQMFLKRDDLLKIAAIRIAPLQDAVDLEDATAQEVALLKKWKQYRVALNRIDQQEGFPTDIQWPVEPS